MGIDDLKKYCVIVNDGSGVFYQPYSSDYTYILTCKHIFYEKIEEESGQIKYSELEDGSKIKVTYLTKDGDNWKENFLNLDLQKKTNYFPHPNEEVDLAILKITPAYEGYSHIFLDEDIENEKNLKLCGYPDNFRSNSYDLRFSTYKIEEVDTIGNYNVNVQLPPTLTIENIKGISGGGILKLSSDSISLFGIQSEMASKLSPTGKISFVKVKYFEEIIDYYKDQLTPLFQQYIKDFRVLKDEILKLKEANDANTKTKLGFITQFKLDHINLSPEDIINEQKDYLLLKGEKKSVLFKKEIWIKYIQYLLFLSIAYEKNINLDLIEEFKKNKRFLYSENEGEFREIIIDILENSNLSNLNNECQIIYGSKNIFASSKSRRIKKGVLTNISQTGNLFKNNQGIDIAHVEGINKIKEIIDINAFETDCIIENEDQIKEIAIANIPELIQLLKTKLYEFFEN